MIEYYRYIDVDNITRYVLIYNGFGFSINYFKICVRCNVDLKSLNVNYCYIQYDNLFINENTSLFGSSLSTLTEEDAIKIVDYLNSICMLNTLQNM